MPIKEDDIALQEIRSGLAEWFAQPLGQMLRDAEARQLSEILPDLFGYYIVQIRCPGWLNDVLVNSRIQHRVTLDRSNDPASAWCNVLGSPDEVPFRTDSVDSLLLLHSLEFEPEPHEVLREAERVLVPEGRLIIVGFNPRSFWGIWRFLFKRSGRPPWCGRFVSHARLKDWLSLLGFDVNATHMLFSRPPFQQEGLLNSLQFMDRLGARWCPFFSAAYILVATKRVSTLTEVRTRWRTGRKILAGGMVEPTTRGNGLG